MLLKSFLNHFPWQKAPPKVNAINFFLNVDVSKMKQNKGQAESKRSNLHAHA